MNSARCREISDFIQTELARRGMEQVTAVQAATWLDRAGIRPDSRTKPGRNLRRLLRSKQIEGQEQMSNSRLFINRCRD